MAFNPARLTAVSAFVRSLIIAMAIPWWVGHAATWFVRPGGSPQPNGRSWEGAFAHPVVAATFAGAGDEIWVAQGHYSGDVIRLAPGVRLIGGFLGIEEKAEGRGLDPSGTILLANDTNAVIWIDGTGSTAMTSISGFTLNPRSGSTPSGRGVIATNAVLTLKHCRLEGFRAPNTSVVTGSALSARQGALTVEDCVFRGNSASQSDGYGAAIGALSVDPIQIRSNAFLGNLEGSATCLALSQCVGEVTDNRFAGNTASSLAVSGSVELHQCRVAVLRNRFLFNRGGFGSGIFVLDRLPSRTNRIEFNLFVGGMTTGNNFFPSGAVSVAGTAVVRVANNTFVGNVEVPLQSSPRNGPVAAVSPDAVTLVNNLFIGHAGGQTCASWPKASRNLLIDIDSPSHREIRALGVVDEFAEREIVGGVRGFSFHLTPHALSRGFGDPSGVTPGSTDAEGRPVPHPDGTVDVGAFAYVPDAAPMMPRILHLRPDGEDTDSGESWGEAMRTLEAAVARAEVSRPTEVWLAAGTYESLSGTHSIPPNLTLRGGFIGNERSPSERPTSPHAITRLSRIHRQSVLPVSGNGPWNEFDRLVLDVAGPTSLPPIQISGCLGVGSWPWIHHCTFLGTSKSIGFGAIHLDGGIVEDCSFISFETGIPWFNGRIIRLADLAPVAVFRRNRIERNQATALASARGIAIAAFGVSAFVSHNLWRSNVVSGVDAALLTTTSVSTDRWPLLLQHNTLLDNVVTDSSRPSGSLIARLSPNHSIRLQGNLIAFNQGVIRVNSTDAANARDNLVHSNGDTAPEFPLHPEFSLDTDPLLVPGDFRLLPGSPAIDAARSAGPEAFARDIDGEGAWLGRHPDIGADESLPALPFTSPIAKAELIHSGIPAVSAVVWRSLESACDDCTDRVWMTSAAADELRLVSRANCIPAACSEPGILRERWFDLGSISSGVRFVKVSSDGIPLRTLAIWMPPSLHGKLLATRFDSSPSIRLDPHPAAPTQILTSPDLKAWQILPESGLTSFVRERINETWFFRSTAK